jgi:predicted NBD/HSP70 family sugar kinase
MKFLGLELHVKNIPALDPGFVPLEAFFEAYVRDASFPFALAVEREGGLISVYDTALRTSGALDEVDRLYVDRLAKALLWLRGGWKLIACGSGPAGKYLRAAYSADGSRAFDRDFMERVYERPFTVECRPYSERPTPRESPAPIGRHRSGCRIGLDAGASNLKVSAVADGMSVFSQTYPWRPKEYSDPAYHLEHLTAVLRAAADHLPGVDAVGISSAGVFVADRCMVASLFLAVGQEDFDRHVKDIYRTAVAALGEGIPYAVANDGDVAALSGAMSLEEGGVLGISLGTSQAGGYVDANGNLTGYFNEVAFAPVDVQEDAARDEWSGDAGCGVKYLSQDGAVRLAEQAGLELSGDSPADRFASLRRHMDAEDGRAAAVYRDLGIYLGHALALYDRFYDIRHALIMGGVAGGTGGDILLAEARRVLADEYPRRAFTVTAPTAQSRQLGQSYAAATLPAGREAGLAP